MLLLDLEAIPLEIRLGGCLLQLQVSAAASCASPDNRYKYNVCKQYFVE